MAAALGTLHSCTVASATALSVSSARMISQQVYLSCKHAGCRSSYACSPTHGVKQAGKDKGIFCWHESHEAKIKKEAVKRHETEMQPLCVLLQFTIFYKDLAGFLPNVALARFPATKTTSEFGKLFV